MLPPPRRKGLLKPPSRKPPRPTIPIQDGLFGTIEQESEYVAKIKAPIYEPKNRKPEIIELVNPGLVPRLVREIDKSSVSGAEKNFLYLASQRHNIFNYQLIADYYSHASPEMQRLMEASALVIIDFKDALLQGFVKYTDDIADIYTKEHNGCRD
jgi:hypothetical protein